MTNAIVYADDIEPPLAGGWKTPEIVSSYLCHLPPLMPIHSRLSGLDIVRRARFNFHKTKNIFVPTYQIDLSSTARSAVVPRDQHITDLAEVEVGVLLSAHAHL